MSDSTVVTSIFTDIYSLDTDIPWIPVIESVSAKPVRFTRNGKGWVSLIHIEPGGQIPGQIPLHRHSGDVQGVVLRGVCRYADSSRLLTPGTYVHEADGTVDEILTVSDEPVEILYVVSGPKVEYLSHDGQVTHTDDQQSKRSAYERFCKADGTVARPLEH